MAVIRPVMLAAYTRRGDNGGGEVGTPETYFDGGAHRDL